MNPRLRTAIGLALLVATLVGCGSNSPSPSRVSPSGSATAAAPFVPVLVSSYFGVGDNRVVFGLVDPTGQKEVSGPTRSVTIAYRGPSGQSIAGSPMTFIWAIEGVKGVYAGHATFPVAGKWTADLTSQAPGSASATVSIGFDVLARSPVVSPGDAAPSVKTPTLADVGGDVSKISSDTKPVKRFYEVSEADALAAHKPFVLIFATPKFCQTATCGPTLDKLKPVAAAHPEMTFINVEPYQLKFDSGSPQPVLSADNQLIPVEATTAFKLQSEPYVFVVGPDGK